MMLIAKAAPVLLIAAITAYIDQHNQDPKAFIWTAKAQDIIRSSQPLSPPWSGCPSAQIAMGALAARTQ